MGILARRPPRSISRHLAADRQEGLDKSGQYALILPLLKATTPQIRAARLKKAIAKLADQ